MVTAESIANVYGLGFALTVTAYGMALIVGVAVSVVRRI